MGEIWVSGPSVARGYWCQPELTASDLPCASLPIRLRDPTCAPATSDFVHAGEVYVTGRLKAVLIIGGRNLHAEDVEHTVATSHGNGWPGGVAAVSIDEGGRERLVIVQEVATRSAGDLEAIARAIRLRVAEQHNVPVLPSC